MKKNNFLVLSLRKNLLPAIFCFFTICLVIFSQQNMQAAKNGLLLWANSVVPSLFPFFIATELLSHTRLIPFLGKLFKPIMKPLFRVPGEGAFAFIMGIISGYPMGAKIATDFRTKQICTQAEGERLLAFTNNSGPLFIIATVGISLFGDVRTGILLLFTHLLACLCVAFVFRFWKRNDSESTVELAPPSQDAKQTICFSNLGEILASSITNSVHTIVMIGGFVVLFSVVICILKQTGIIALTSNLLSPILALFRDLPRVYKSFAYRTS